VKRATFFSFIRKKKGLTQEELARRLGISQTLVSRYENGYVIPSPHRRRYIAGILRVKVRDLWEKKRDEYTTYYKIRRGE